MTQLPEPNPFPDPDRPLPAEALVPLGELARAFAGAAHRDDTLSTGVSFGPKLRGLFSGAPREILANIVRGDPLGVTMRVNQRIDELALLVSGARVLAKTFAHIAYSAHGYRGDPVLATWLRSRVDRALDDLLNEDEEREADGLPAEQVEPLHALLSESLAIELGLARKACCVFNRLPLSVRRAFYAVAVQGKSINRVVAEGFGPPTEVERRVRIAMRSMSLLKAVDVRPEDGDE